MPTNQQEEPFVHIRMGDCEFEMRGPAQLLERQVLQFYLNAVTVNGGRHTRQYQKEDEAQ